MMKLNLKKTTMLLSGLMIGSQLFAQTDSIMAKQYVQPFSPNSAFRTWSIGINAGIASPYTFIGGKQDFRNRDANLGYGGYIKHQIFSSFGVQADFFGGKLSGGGAPTGGSTSSIYGSYSTQIHWANLT
jgi:OOP family OmpA-OmpF porin